MATPIKLASVEGSIELDRDIYKECVTLVKSKRPVRVVSFNEPDHAPAFMHYIENAPKPFAVAIYYQQKKARYFVVLKSIPLALRAMITRLEKEHEKQDKLPSFVPAAQRAQPVQRKTNFKIGSGSRGITIQPRDVRSPFRAKH